ncbi:MAG: type II toxin-antitoxin system RelE/ParE family toxin, partial [Alphaproteobacteria bacterium]
GMEITWRRIALSDLEDMRRHIAQENPAAGARIRAAIRNAVERLADHPYLGRSGRVEGTRELVIAGTPFIASSLIGSGSSQLSMSRQWPERF